MQVTGKRRREDPEVLKAMEAAGKETRGMKVRRSGVKVIDKFKSNHRVMAKSNVRRGDKGSGAGFVNQQRTKDEAKNERQREERGTDKLDPEHASRRKFSERKPGVSEKKAGAGKHN